MRKKKKIFVSQAQKDNTLGIFASTAWKILVAGFFVFVVSQFPSMTHFEQGFWIAVLFVIGIYILKKIGFIK